jgi:hypothetical protein
VAARWALAFSVAAVVVLLGATTLRFAARSGVGGVRRRGTLVVATGALVGGLFLPDVPGRLAVVAALALALVVLGTIFVERVPPRGGRLALLAAAAIAAVAAGVRLEWTGVGALDVAGTVVLIVAVANALRWSDTADGMAAATRYRIDGSLAIRGRKTGRSPVRRAPSLSLPAKPSKVPGSGRNGSWMIAKTSSSTTPTSFPYALSFKEANFIYVRGNAQKIGASRHYMALIGSCGWNNNSTRPNNVARPDGSTHSMYSVREPCKVSPTPNDTPSRVPEPPPDWPFSEA